MRKIAFASSMVAAVALMAASGSAMAQIEPGSQEVQAYGGHLLGKEFTDRAISGRRPTLKDDWGYGLRYGYNFTDNFGLEVSLAQVPTEATRLAGGNVDADITMLDFDAIVHLMPQSRIVPYFVAGVGYADADFDRDIRGTVNGQDVRLRGDDGFMANAGLGAKFFLNDQMFLRLDGRYRYIHRLVDRFDDSMDTFETTFGLSWQF